MIVNTNTAPNPQDVKEGQAKLSYIGLGKQDAETAINLLNKGGNYMKETLVKRAEQFAANADTIKGYLTGWGEVSGKTRKSEAKAVFEAFAKDSKRVLASLEKAYPEFLADCREIRGQGQNNGGRKGDKVTDNQQNAIIERVPLMTADQAKQLNELTLVQLQNTVENWETALLVQIESACELLKESPDLGFKAMADKIGMVVFSHFAKLEQAKNEAQEQTNLSEIEGIQVPQPLAA